jgi:hypothetical protein
MAVFAPPDSRIFKLVACGASNGLGKWLPYHFWILNFFESSGGKLGLQPKKKQEMVK